MNMRILFLMATMAVAGTVSAEQGPKVDYSADYTMETADMAMQGKMYYSPGMERRESEQDGDKSIMIVRHDKKVVWMLMTEQNAYMENPIPKAGNSGDLSAFKLKTTRVGNETMNGVKTTKSKLIMTGPRGQKMGGFIWTSKEGIAVKVDAIAVDKKSKERFKMELKNLQVGKQDHALFEIPADYTKMDMGGMGKLMGGGGHGSKQAQDNKKGGGFGLKDALDMLK